MTVNRLIKNRCFVAVCLLIIVKSSTWSAAIPWNPTVSGSIADWNQQSAIKWLSVSGSPGEDWINRVIETSDGSIVAAGYIGRKDDSKEPPDWTAVALKYSAAGKLLWSSAFGGPGVDAVWAVREISNHNFVMAGFSVGRQGNGWAAYLGVLNAKGGL